MDWCALTRAVAEDLDGAAVHLAERLDLDVIAVHPRLALAANILAEILGNILREVIFVRALRNIRDTPASQCAAKRSHPKFYDGICFTWR